MKAQIASLWGLFLFPYLLMSQTASHKVYLIPGQGADYRSFQFLELDDCYETEVLEHPLPFHKERMESLARRTASSIDTTQPYSLVGVSLGGMLAMEMSKFLEPEHIIIVASIKGRHEMPWRYKMLGVLPLYKLFGGNFYNYAANVVRPWFEYDSGRVDDISRLMLADKHPKYLRRAIHCIMTWDNTTVPDNLTHIHGDKDNTLPYKHIEDAICIPGGTHMMIMTSAKEVSAIINDTLGEGRREK